MSKAVSCTAGFILVLFLSGWAQGADYVGSETCFKCHPNQYNQFKVSGHPYKLTKAEDARKRPLPLPSGFSWDDITYVIGGATKKARYVDKKGYVITAAKDGSELKTQYNLEDGSWSFYNKGQKTPYNCGTCHTTGYDKEGHQDGMEGMIGTWAAPGIQCEACHGPGADHAKSGDKGKIKIARDSAACGQCHIRGSKDKIPAGGGFISHHEQYNELLAGPHKSLDCVSCHNPHQKAQFSIKKDCASCHEKQVSAYKGSAMEQVGVQCVECHMPKATKSAISKGKNEGDIRTHIFKINTDASANMFYTEEKDGKKNMFARGFVTLNFACLNCHKNKDLKWAEGKAKGIHSYGK